MTVRHLFLFCGIFESIPNCINYHINDSFFSKILTVSQYHNSKRGTVLNTGSTTQNRLFWSAAHVQDNLFETVPRTDFYPDSFKYYTGLPLNHTLVFKWQPFWYFSLICYPAHVGSGREFIS